MIPIEFLKGDSGCFVSSVLLLSLALMGINVASARRARAALVHQKICRKSADASSKNQPLAGNVICVLVVLTVYSVLLAVLQRWFSAFLIGLGLILALWAGNRLKEEILDEPLVFSDVFLAGHALRYPRLYFGYAPLWFWPLLLMAIAALGAGISWEPEAGAAWAAGAAWGFILLDVLVSVMLWIFKGWAEWLLRSHPLAFSANEDAARYTPIGASFFHLLWHAQFRRKMQEEVRLKESRSVPDDRTSQKSAVAERPRHLLMVQAESFAPIHELLGRKSVIPGIEKLMKEGRGGMFDLDWRGAYTMRSEFSVLTGRRMSSVGTYGFDPYRLAAMEPMDSIAWDLRRAGWRTIAWHPNDGRFFDRIHVLRNLGFEDFWDLKKLQARYGDRLKKHGRYVSDAALLGLAAEFLESQAEKTFLFIITMENHGPWSAAMQGEEMKQEEGEGRGTADSLTNELHFYEAHLSSLDAGVRSVMNAVASGDLRSDFVLYGDHIPGLKVLSIDRMTERWGQDKRWTAWVYWRLGMTPISQNIRPECLRRVILGEQGLTRKLSELNSDR